MSGGPFANEDVMDNYFSDLLTEALPGADIQRQSVRRLLDTAQATGEPVAHIDDLLPIVAEPKSAQVLKPEVEKEVEPLVVMDASLPEMRPTEAFQVLFFEVAGLTLALPLTELGGIHQLEKINPIPGKSDWFKGVMLHRDKKFNVVDTAKWIMPQERSEKLTGSTEYKYLIILDESGWGLACESLVTTIILQPDDVKWRKVDSKRPWLAGMIKKKMCALVNVKQLVSILNKGLSSNG
ncbi:MAG: purine-binding chemotaxis protein CheW [Paraglaciecola sp.]|jgi:purine-binding chemotaxis protein CheW